MFSRVFQLWFHVLVSQLVLVQCERVEIPLSSVKKADDISAKLPPSEVPDAPEGFSWKGYTGAINISTNILFPYEGQVVENMFDVMLEIAATPLGAFKERFVNAFQCVEVDQTPPACWPMFDDSPIPRLYLSDGPHQLRSAVTGTDGEWVLPSTWSPVRSIMVAVSAVVPSGPEDSEDSSPPESPEDEGPIKMDVPVLKVVSPPEMGVITSRMVEMQFEVATQSQDQFQEHFQHSYICGRLLDAAEEVAYCWSIYQTSWMPRWVGLEDGFYTLRASVTHPNTNEIITESWGELSAFLVLSENKLDLKLGQDADPSEEPPPNHIVLSIDLRNAQKQVVAHQLPVQRNSKLDYKLLAKRFCRSRGVGNAECVDHIVSEAKSKLLALDKLHLDWQQRVNEKAQRQASQAEARAKQEAELLKRTFKVPEGDLLIVPELGDEALETYLFTAVHTCAKEYEEGGVGLECLTIQSELFGMRAKLKNIKSQEALLDFIGNLGAGYGF